MFGSVAFLVLLVFSLFTLRALWVAWRGWRAAGWLRDPPEGLVLVEGTTAPRGGLRKATLSGHSCLWEAWEVEVWRAEHRTGQHHTPGHWQRLEAGASRDPFLLTTPQGHRILLCPEAVDTRMLPARRWTGTAPRPGGEAGLLSEMTGGLLGRRHRYTERLVLPALPLFALGRPELPAPGDPPGIDGRLLPGPGGMLLGLEPPAQAAARLRRQVVWGAVASAGALLFVLTMLLGGPWALPALLGFGGLGGVGR